MEEADALCDRLMIMADGESKCIGVSADLKNRFGRGFKISVQVGKKKNDQAAARFMKQNAVGNRFLMFFLKEHFPKS